MKRLVFCLCILALAALPASASTLYTNGPVSGNFGAYYICCGSAVEDSFTLSSRSSLSSLTFYVWAYPGDTMYSVDWGVVTTPGNYNTPNYAATSQTYLFTNTQYDFDIDEETISLSGIYAPGTYYMVLAGAGVSNSDAIFWDINNNPSSTAYVNYLGGNQSNMFLTGTNSDPFTIYGSNVPPPPAVPEPCTVLLVGSGLASLAARRMRRRSNG